jgi:hypothetical protein
VAMYGNQAVMEIMNVFIEIKIFIVRQYYI